MSLQLAAQHMASRGRGPDSTLVHMAPQEVAGLQALAKAHGGSLTVNPDTGLPEAGFLSSILPTVIGVGLSVASGGTLTPLMAAGITGAGYGVATGSLKKGLMAGLGAYGGAGLAGGLMGAGAAGVGAGAAEAGMAGIAPGIEGTTAAMSGGFGGGSALAGTEAAGAALGTEGTTAAMSGGFGGGTGGGALAGVSPAATPIQAQQAVINAAPQTVTPMADKFSQLGRGFQNLGTEAGRDAFMSKEGIGGGMGLLKYGYAAGLPLLMQQDEQKTAEKAKEDPWRYTYAPGRVSDPQAGYTGAYTGERTHLNPVYTRTAAGGGLMDLGPVESMSNQNQAETLMANGGQRFAEGGETKAVKPVEENPYYTMSGQSGDAFKYLMGQGPKPTPAAASVVAAPVQSTVQPTAGAQAGAMGLLKDFLFKNSFGGLGQQPMSPEAQAAGGEWVDDTSGLMKPYSFDPTTGTFAAAPVPKVWRSYAPPATVTDYGGGIASLAQGGQSHLGDYSDGGRLLRGPGDGVSDDIPASIGDKRPARLADGEFVVPARIVSELGNGSTEAGARKLYAMMDRVQKARAKTTGKDRVAVNSRAEKLLPA